MAAEAEYRQLGRGGGPDWTNLPEPAIDQILDMLDSHKDYLRFLLVCKTWRYYALRLWPYKKSNYKGFLAHHPMLVVGNHVYSVGTGKLITTSEATTGCLFEWPVQPWPSPRSQYPGLSVIGSSFGWLVTHRILTDDHGLVLLTNPQANRCLKHIVRLSPASNRHLLDGFHPCKAVLSADPSRSSTYCLAILLRKSSSEVTRLLFLQDIHLGTQDGTEQFYHNSDHVLDIARDGNNIYVLQKEIPGAVNVEPRGLVIATLSCTGGLISKAKIAYVRDDIPFERKPLPPSVDHHSSSAYLVERLPGGGGCCSVGYNPWLVMRHRIIRELDGAVRTVGFGVFEWVHSRMDPQGSMLWSRVHELKNEALFLGRNSAFSIPAGSGLLDAGGLEPNYIYFFDDQQLNTEKENLVIAPDMGAFDVVQGCLKPFGFPREFNHLLDYDVMKNHASPIWFTAPLV